MCFRVSDVGIFHLTGVSSVNKLQELNVSHCSLITDISVKRIAERYNRITVYTYKHIVCIVLFISVMQQLFCVHNWNRLCKLHHLNLSYCVKLTNTSLEWLNGSSICSLDISGCNIQDKVPFECFDLQSLTVKHIPEKKITYPSVEQSVT